MAQEAMAQPVKGQTDHLGRACRSTRVEPSTPIGPKYMFYVGYELTHLFDLVGPKI